MLLALVLQLLEDLEELASDLALIMGVKPHPRHADVAQFGCDQVLHCVHVLFVVVDTTPLSGPGAACRACPAWILEPPGRDRLP